MQFTGLAQVNSVVCFFEDGYAEVAKVESGKLHAFAPITEGFLETLNTSNVLSKQLSGEVSANIIAYKPMINKYKIVFRVKAITKEITHNEKRVKIDFPDMIWFYSFNRSLNIYKDCKKGIVQPISFSNVNNGLVCIGTSPHPKSSEFKTAISEIKDMFFEGEFTHAENKLKYGKEMELWRIKSNFLNI